MPGFEVLGLEEQTEVNNVFEEGGGILFRHGFDGLRNNSYKVKEFETAFAKFMNVKYALAVTSGTAALRVALAALDISKGDEVVTQSFTFVATVESIIESGATPVCTEIDKTLNMDPEDLKKRITPQTKAVIVVHMLGTPARLNEIKQICDDNGVALIEDTAWGCGGDINNRKLGTWGRMGTFSFDFAKTMTTGEGGMILFEREEDYKKAAAWHDHGHENNPKVPRWEDTRSSSGFNFRMMELQGAIGLAQLKKLPFVIERQRSNKERIWNKISSLQGVGPRTVPSESYETADALVFFAPTKELAIACRESLLDSSLGTKILPEAYTWHFAATWSHMKELCDAHKGELLKSFPVSTELLSRSVSLPVGVYMDDDIDEKIYSALKKVLDEA